MREVKIKGVTIQLPDELAKEIDEQPKDEISFEDIEQLLKEIDEWLALGRSKLLKDAEATLRKQLVGGVMSPEIATAIPRGSGVTGSVSGVVAAPNVPSWLAGNPQAQQAAAQVAVSSLVESVVNTLQAPLQTFVDNLANLLQSSVRTLVELVDSVATRIAEAQERMVEAAEKLGERLEEIANKLPGEEKEVAPEEELLPPPPEVPEAPEEETMTPTEAAPAEEVPQPELPETPETPEEEARQPAAAAIPPSPSAAVLSPEFLAAFAHQLSQMTKDFMNALTRRPQERETPKVSVQSPFEIADMIASMLTKGGAGKPEVGGVKADMTEPVSTAKAPEKGESVEEQVKDASQDEHVKKPLKEAAEKV